MCFSKHHKSVSMNLNGQTLEQVGMGEILLRIRRVKDMQVYWVYIQAHSRYNPTKNILQECWEHHQTNS